MLEFLYTNRHECFCDCDIDYKCAGKQIPYSEIQSMIEDKSIVVRWDSFQLSPYFEYQGQDGKDYQVSLGLLWFLSSCLLTTFTYHRTLIGKGRLEKRLGFIVTILRVACG